MKKLLKFRSVYLLACAILFLLVATLPAAPLMVRANAGDNAHNPQGYTGQAVILDEEVPLANLPLSSAPLVNVPQSPLVQASAISLSPALVLTLAIALISLGLTLLARPLAKKLGAGSR